MKRRGHFDDRPAKKLANDLAHLTLSDSKISSNEKPPNASVPKPTMAQDLIDGSEEIEVDKRFLRIPMQISPAKPFYEQPSQSLIIYRPPTPLISSSMGTNPSSESDLEEATMEID